MRYLKYVTLFCLLCAHSGVIAAEGDRPVPVSVAVLNFQQVGVQDKALSEAAMSTIEAELSGLDNLLLLERQQLDAILDEQAMNISGIVNAEQSVKIGMLTGSQVLVSGKLIEMGDDTMMMVKIMGTETGRVFVVKHSYTTSELGLPQLDAFATEVAATVNEKRMDLLPTSSSTASMTQALKQAMAGKSLPSMAIEIPEFHISRPIPDPAAETAVASIWRDLGGEILAYDDENLKPDVIILGEAFSEFGMRKGDLVSCMARVEVKAYAPDSGRILYQGAVHSVAVDLGENIAAKKALTDAGYQIAAEMIPVLAQAK